MIHPGQCNIAISVVHNSVAFLYMVPPLPHPRHNTFAWTCVQPLPVHSECLIWIRFCRGITVTTLNTLRKGMLSLEWSKQTTTGDTPPIFIVGLAYFIQKRIPWQNDFRDRNMPSILYCANTIVIPIVKLSFARQHQISPVRGMKFIQLKERGKTRKGRKEGRKNGREKNKEREE